MRAFKIFIFSFKPGLLQKWSKELFCLCGIYFRKLSESKRQRNIDNSITKLEYNSGIVTDSKVPWHSDEDFYFTDSVSQVVSTGLQLYFKPHSIDTLNNYQTVLLKQCGFLSIRF